jgi:hypothetical protein
MTTKNIIKKAAKILITAFLLMGMMPVNQIFAQDDEAEIEKISPMLRLTVTKNQDNTRVLAATLSYRDPETREVKQVVGASLIFVTGWDNRDKIETIQTDSKGNAKCILPADYVFLRNKDGYIYFAVEFEGNELLDSKESELEIIDIALEISFEIIDSVKTVLVKAEKILGEGKTEELSEESIPVFVNRMFSHLKIGEIDLENGEGVFEFPSNIPGDTLGMLTVIAKFEEHETFATVLKGGEIDWGVVTSHHTVYHARSLWTQVAPVWMIVTLSIMLLGVWGHYIYTIIQLIRLKRIKPEPAE